MFRYQRALLLVIGSFFLSLGITGCGADGISEKIDNGADSISKRNAARQTDWDAGRSTARSDVASAGADPLANSVAQASQGNGTTYAASGASYDMPNNTGMGTGDILKMGLLAAGTIAITSGAFDLGSIFPQATSGPNANPPAGAIAQNGQQNSGANAQAQVALKNAYSWQPPKTLKEFQSQILKETQAIVQKQNGQAPSAATTQPPQSGSVQQGAIVQNDQRRSSGDENKSAQATAAKPNASGSPACSTAAAPSNALDQNSTNAILAAAEKQKTNSPVGTPAGGTETNVSENNLPAQVAPSNGVQGGS